MPQTDQPVKGMYIRDDNKIYQIIDRKLKTQGRQGGLIIMKMKALDTGQQIEKTIKAGVKLEQVQPETVAVQYMYSDGKSSYFMDSNTYETVAVEEDIIGDYNSFLKEGDTCLVMKLEGRVIAFKENPTVDLEIIEAEPAVKGNTANAAMKNAKVETGYSLKVPLFIKKGDIIRINTDTGEYSGKAN